MPRTRSPPSPPSAPSPSLLAGCAPAGAAAGARRRVRRRRRAGARVVLPAAVRRRAGRRRPGRGRRRSRRPAPSRTTSSSPPRRSARSATPTSCSTCPASRPRSTRPSRPASPRTCSTPRTSSTARGRRRRARGEEHAEDEHADDEHAERRARRRRPALLARPERLAAVAGAVADALAEADPEDADDVRRRTPPRSTSRARPTLDAALRGRPRDLRAPGVVTRTRRSATSPTRYDLEQVGHHRPRPRGRAVPRPAARDRRRSCADEGVTTMFTETLVSPKVAETLAADLGVDTAVLDPVEGLAGPGRATTVAVMRAEPRRPARRPGLRVTDTPSSGPDPAPHPASRRRGVHVVLGGSAHPARRRPHGRPTARSSRCSAPTAPASRPSCARCVGAVPVDVRRRVGCSAHPLGRARAVGAASGTCPQRVSAADRRPGDRVRGRRARACCTAAALWPPRGTRAARVRDALDHVGLDRPRAPAGPRAVRRAAAARAHRARAGPRRPTCSSSTSRSPASTCRASRRSRRPLAGLRRRAARPSSSSCTSSARSRPWCAAPSSCATARVVHDGAPPRARARARRPTSTTTCTRTTTTPRSTAPAVAGLRWEP